MLGYEEDIRGRVRNGQYPNGGQIVSETEVHLELCRHLKTDIEGGATYHGVTYTAAIPEYSTTAGVADVVVESSDSAFLVIEAKRPGGGPTRDFDPYSVAVVRRAASVALEIGAPYFATYNGNRCVVFGTSPPDTPLVDREYQGFDVTSPRQFAPELLDAVASLHRGEATWPPGPDAFVERLGTVHSRLADEFERAFSEKVESDPEFADEYEDWIGTRGWTNEYDQSPRAVDRRYVDQSAYLLVNRLVYYKLLVETGVYPSAPVDLEQLADPQERRERFDDLVDEIGFGAIFERDEIFDALPLTERARVEIGDLLDELDEYALTDFDRDVVGYIYQRLVPREERHSLGQYYTPPKIVDFITRTTVRAADDTVFDPACGSGRFLTNAYNHLEELGDNPGHAQLLSQLYGVDVNRFPVHLTALNLAIQDPTTEPSEVNVERADFFHVDPGRVAGSNGDTERADGSGEFERGTVFPASVDAVVANPPYVRQELVDKARCREHLKRNQFAVDIDERSDIYSYFFTHASEFLSEDGRIGMITPDKWLSVEYGKGLREFFLERFEIRAIVSFPSRVFDDALVPTCVTLLERQDNLADRQANTVKFIRLKADVDLEIVERLVDEDTPDGQLRDDPSYRMVTKRQDSLQPAETWDTYLSAPPVYWDLVAREELEPLSAFVDVTRGITSGANRFFYLSEDDKHEWNIDDRFLDPLAKTVRGKAVPRLADDDLDRYVLTVGEYAKQVSPEDVRPRNRLNGALTTDRLEELTERERDVLEGLLRDGYDGVYRYLTDGMWQRDWQHGPPHERRTVLQYRRSRGLWFDLGELRPAGLLASKEYWEYGRPLAFVNESEAIADQQLYVLETDRDTYVLGGILNSSWGALVRELHGRTTGGGMNRLAVYEAETLPVPDPQDIDSDIEDRIRTAFRSLLDADDGCEELDCNAREELDRSVLAAMGAEERAAEVTRYAEALSKARQERSEIGRYVSGLESGGSAKPFQITDLDDE